MPAREIISAKRGRPLMKNHRKLHARAAGQHIAQQGRFTDAAVASPALPLNFTAPTVMR
jgi:hypothetical protein